MPADDRTQQRIRVLLADDHRLFRQGLRQICEIKGGFEVVGEAQNGKEAVQLAAELEPDVILMDINMPVLNGIQATGQIMQANPQARVLILTMYRQDHYAFDAITAGAQGYLLKNADADTVVEAVRAAQRGEALVDPVTAARVLDEFRRLSQTAAVAGEAGQLTEGEMDVLRLVAQGANNQAIGQTLYLSPQTVANRLRSIYSKLGVDNRTEAALYALKRGWATLNSEEEGWEHR